MYYWIQLHVESCDLWILPTTPLVPENILKNSAAFKRLFITKNTPLGWNKLLGPGSTSQTGVCLRVWLYLSYHFQMQQPHLTATVILKKFSNSSMRIPVLAWKLRSSLKLSLATQGRMQTPLCVLKTVNVILNTKYWLFQGDYWPSVWTQHKK